MFKQLALVPLLLIQRGHASALVPLLLIQRGHASQRLLGQGPALDQGPTLGLLRRHLLRTCGLIVTLLPTLAAFSRAPCWPPAALIHISADSGNCLRILFFHCPINNTVVGTFWFNFSKTLVTCSN